MRFSNYPNVFYAVSTTADGNMSFKEDKKEALENRRLFAKKKNLSGHEFFGVKQIHGNNVVIINKSSNPSKEKPADGIITDLKNTYLLIKSADCLSIAFYDPINQTIGLSHAGWRGLDLDILKQTIVKMRQTYGTNPKDLIVEFSPSIGPCHYGGPPELRNTKDSRWKEFIAKDVDENHGIDLWSFANDELVKVGVLEKNIHNPKICNFEDAKYYSHKRAIQTGKSDFRFATILGLRS